MKKNVLEYVVCPICRKGNMTVESSSGDQDEIIEGTVKCKNCGICFSVDKGILDLRPKQLRNFGNALNCESGSNVKIGCIEKDDELGSNHELPTKLRQLNFYNKFNAEDYERRVEKSTYYQALNEATFLKWSKENIETGDHIIDLGSGTGKISMLLAQRNVQCIGIDISKDMLLIARKKAMEHNLLCNIDLILADAENPPFKKDIFDAVIMSGTLHHVPDPLTTIRNAAALLKCGGCFFSLDPHDSPVRFLFDILMRFWRIYNEEASDDPLLRKNQLAGWTQISDITGKIKLSTYLPPHFFNLFSKDISLKLLELSDKILNRVPFIRNFAGVIYFEGFKI